MQTMYVNAQDIVLNLFISFFFSLSPPGPKKSATALHALINPLCPVLEGIIAVAKGQRKGVCKVDVGAHTVEYNNCQTTCQPGLSRQTALPRQH